MAGANEENNHNGKTKKSEWLPTGEKARAIIEVLVAMFRDSRNPEDPTEDDAAEKDAHPDEDGKEQFR